MLLYEGSDLVCVPQDPLDLRRRNGVWWSGMVVRVSMGQNLDVEVVQSSDLGLWWFAYWLLGLLWGWQSMALKCVPEDVEVIGWRLWSRLLGSQLAKPYGLFVLSPSLRFLVFLFRYLQIGEALHLVRWFFTTRNTGFSHEKMLRLSTNFCGY